MHPNPTSIRNELFNKDYLKVANVHGIIMIETETNFINVYGLKVIYFDENLNCKSFKLEPYEYELLICKCRAYIQ